MSLPSHLHILGRQPALGLAELESYFGAANVRPAGSEAAIVQTGLDRQHSFNQLGGSIKAGQLLETVTISDWPRLMTHLEGRLADYLAAVPAGKLKFGLSSYGFNVNSRKLGAAALDLKRQIKATGRSVRVVPNQAAALSSAQLLHNGLTGELGFELLLVRDGQRTHIGRSFAGQDIDSYTQRDRVRPKRDAFVGMLPPKLAQIIINLALGDSRRQTPAATTRLLDPFCGTGVILQEGLLMGLPVYGSDLEARMVDYSRTNLAWLGQRYSLPSSATIQLEVGDATQHQWQQPIDTVAAETYLGTPLSHAPTIDRLNEIVMNCNLIHRKFLRNLAGQLPPDSRLCLAAPAWRLNSGQPAAKAQFRHLPFIDELSALGYNRVDLTHVATKDLLYYRDDQLVARELLVLTRR